MATKPSLKKTLPFMILTLWLAFKLSPRATPGHSGRLLLTISPDLYN